MDEQELRDLQERTHQIRELTRQRGWVFLADYCASVIAAKNRSLLNGNAKTIEDYRSEAGWIRGAQFVLTAADQLDEQLEREIQLQAEYKAAEEMSL